MFLILTTPSKRISPNARHFISHREAECLFLPQFDLKDRIAVLASAGGDEAPFLAAALAEAGATVFAITRRQESLDAILKALSQEQRDNRARHNGMVTTLDSPDVASRVVAEVNTTCGPVDILVNDNRSMFARAATKFLCRNGTRYSPAMSGLLFCFASQSAWV